MHKPNVVIVHSFPGNSKMLDGYYRFLGDYFNIIPINLPGFDISMSPPLKEVKIKHYVAHVEEKIKDLSLTSYLLAGLSFGFSVVNQCQVDDRCKGKVAIFPFLNTHYLKQMPTRKERFLLTCVRYLGLHRLVYESQWFRKILSSHIPKRSLDIMLSSIDPYTFFETLHEILHYREEPVFADCPYVLIVNEEDETVDGRKIIDRFKKLPKSLILHTVLPHHPTHPSKEYFKQYVSIDELKKIITFTSH